MNKLTVSYSTIKKLLNTIPTYYITTSNGYSLFCVGDDDFIKSHISLSQDISNFESTYKNSAVSVVSEDDALVLGKIKNKTPFVPQKSLDGKVRVAMEKVAISTTTAYSHNWCDKTTWYEKATRVIEDATREDGYVYNLSHAHVVDTYHGKITNEDYIKSNDGYSFRVVVKLNGVTKVEQNPHYGTGGDYTINYNLGKITFLTELAVDDVVNVTYHYAGSSLFTLKPDSGKVLKLGIVDVQFSTDLDPLDSIVFQPYGFVEIFASSYCTINGGPYPPGTRIPLGSPLVYKTMNDFLNDSKRSYPVYPKIAPSNWRGLGQDCIVMNWDYEGEKLLRSDYGMEIRIFLEHDCVFGGEFATATFYCKSESL